MSDDSVVVTGGAGFIGSNLVDRLLDVGFRVTVIDDLSVGSMSNLECASKYGSQFAMVRQDITSAELLDVMEAVKPRYVFHLAAQAAVRHSMSDPMFDARVNILGSLNVIESSRRTGVERILYSASGGTLYGEPDPSRFPLTEVNKHQPLSNYGVSKRAVLDYLGAYRAIYGLEYVALALANVYGPRQDPHGESGVVSIFAGNLRSRQRCVIFGDGNQTRDFIFVADVVEAFIQALHAGDGEVVNISSSTETSVNELYWEIAKIVGSSLEPEFLAGRVGELGRSCLSNKKAREILGWKPQVSLSDGLGQVIDWISSQG
ncbi:MAG: NAD-dependent epimerase/dehydratase family protein [Actinomycetota bacterium]|nr:MAG: NAD-dependent epimerase/dehydratase family protein [Actinomycetota bacterium]